MIYVVHTFIIHFVSKPHFKHNVYTTLEQLVQFCLKIFLSLFLGVFPIWLFIC